MVESAEVAGDDGDAVEVHVGESRTAADRRAVREAVRTVPVLRARYVRTQVAIAVASTGLLAVFAALAVLTGSNLAVVVVAPVIGLWVGLALGHGAVRAWTSLATSYRFDAGGARVAMAAGELVVPWRLSSTLFRTPRALAIVDDDQPVLILALHRCTTEQEASIVAFARSAGATIDASTPTREDDGGERTWPSIQR